MTKETGGSALRKSEKGQQAAELILPGDDRVVPASVALVEAIAILWIDIAAEFPAALLGSKCPNHFPEARNRENRESTFDWTNDRSACNRAILVKDTSECMRPD